MLIVETETVTTVKCNKQHAYYKTSARKKQQHLKVSFKNKIHDGLVHLDKNHNLYTF